jgi:Bacterial Ig-like domain (group 3)
VTLTTLVSGQPGVTPMGTVSLVDTANGQQTNLASGVALTNGTATTQVVLPAVEANAITATYSGDSDNGPSTSPAETAFVVPVAHQLAVTQLRFSGPGATGRGIDDWYVNLVNKTAFPLQLAGWNVNVAYSDGGTAGLPMPAGLTLPPGGAYLAAGSDYSLDQVAFPDFAFNGQLSDDIIGAQIVPPNGGAAVDEVGYPNAPPGYQGSAGALPTLTPAVPSPGVQYAFVRHGSQAVPVDTNDNGADFSLVSVGGGTVGGQTAVVGTPSPLSTTSGVEQANATMPSTLFDPAQPASACPNRIYIPGTAGGRGTLVVNRTITNNTGHIITLAGLRITSLTQQGGPPATGHAWLRAVPTTVTTSPCGGPMGQPLTLNGPAGTGTDGGLGTTLSPPVPFMPPGATITVAFQFAVDQGGPFTFGYDVDILLNT